MFLCLFDFIFGFLLAGPVFVLCYYHFFLFRAVFSISVSLSCPVCLVVLQIACLLLDE